MSNNKLDNLFKEKLEGLETSPRPEAWSKLHGQLNEGKNRTRVLLWRVAAILLVVFSVLFVVYQNQKVGIDKGISRIQPIELNEKNQESEITDPIAATLTPKENNSQDPDVAEKQEKGLDQIAIKSENHENKNSIDNQEDKAIASTENSEAEKSGLDNTNQEADKNLINMPIDNATIADNSTSIKENKRQVESNENIEKVLPIQEEADLIANDMIAKVPEKEMNNELKNTETDHSITPNVVITFIGGSETPENSVREEDQQRFGLKKVLTIASEIKNGEGGLADLRKKKDELLALNFNKKNMSKTQDK